MNTATNHHSHTVPSQAAACRLPFVLIAALLLMTSACADGLMGPDQPTDEAPWTSPAASDQDDLLVPPHRYQPTLGGKFQPSPPATGKKRGIVYPEPAGAAAPTAGHPKGDSYHVPAYRHTGGPRTIVIVSPRWPVKRQGAPDASDASAHRFTDAQARADH